jgi:ATP-dependent DNA ligase
VPRSVPSSRQLSQDLLQGARQFKLEGLTAKRPNSLYESGRRSGAWVKVKLTQEQEFVIGGYTPPEGTRKYFGALLVGYYGMGGILFAGRVVTGYSEKALDKFGLDVDQPVPSESPCSGRSLLGLRNTGPVVWAKRKQQQA